MFHNLLDFQKIDKLVSFTENYRFLYLKIIHENTEKAIVHFLNHPHGKNEKKIFLE